MVGQFEEDGRVVVTILCSGMVKVGVETIRYNHQRKFFHCYKLLWNNVLACEIYKMQSEAVAWVCAEHVCKLEL